jgi:hypothetical protein
MGHRGQLTVYMHGQRLDVTAGRSEPKEQKPYVCIAPVRRYLCVLYIQEGGGVLITVYKL